ncbi:MAG: translation elongation factor-like protein [Candidatus Bathyarchaeota archaeon]|nr:translation elongation factor-like protein [Candidatus Bathyarchaeota archaeon]MDH5419688.1 translation elongation factor-like protein [Candidatus Bathyarchaeota archaeon]MDH5635330.1 translation elongation factor-like protein [Candidatus Bathyarchaeota archaeon]
MKFLSEELQEVGRVSHFFTKISVAVIELTATISVGDRILIKGPTTNLEQTIDSMEIEHEKVQKAGAGQSIGLKVKDRVRETDIVYKIA